MLSYLQKRQPSATQTAAGTFVPSTLIVIDPDIFDKKIRHRDEHSDQAVNSSPSSGRSGWPLPTAASMYPLQALWFSVRNGHKSNLWHPSWLMNTLILITRCMSSFQGTVPCAHVPPRCSHSCLGCILRFLCWQGFAGLSSNGAELRSSSHALHHLADC